MELVKGSVKVELVELGEGFCGDYDPTDPDDMELLRFDVSRRGESGEWEEVPDASYCTLLPALMSDAKKEKALKLLMDEFYAPVTNGQSVKRLGEKMSWIAPDWLEGDKR